MEQVINGIFFGIPNNNDELERHKISGMIRYYKENGKKCLKFRNLMDKSYQFIEFKDDGSENLIPLFRKFTQFVNSFIIHRQNILICESFKEKITFPVILFAAYIVATRNIEPELIFQSYFPGRKKLGCLRIYKKPEGIFWLLKEWKIIYEAETQCKAYEQFNEKMKRKQLFNEGIEDTTRDQNKWQKLPIENGIEEDSGIWSSMDLDDSQMDSQNSNANYDEFWD